MILNGHGKIVMVANVYIDIGKVKMDMDSPSRKFTAVN